MDRSSPHHSSNLTQGSTNNAISSPPQQTSPLDIDSSADSRQPHHHLTTDSLPAAPGRFREEWDASQRGSSILDGHQNERPLIASDHPADTMQRSESVRSYAAGDDQTLPYRGNTLKKKSSMRGTGSIRRSSSRRSTRAGSVKSLALQSASDPDEGHSAFYCPVPTSGNPTEILANRFQSKSSRL